MPKSLPSEAFEIMVKFSPFSDEKKSSVERRMTDGAMMTFRKVEKG